MKKSFINIKNFVDSNVRQYRIDRASSSNTSIDSLLGRDLQIIEIQFDHLRQVCLEAEKRISSTLSMSQASSLSVYYSNLTNNAATQATITPNPNQSEMQNSSDTLSLNSVFISQGINNSDSGSHQHESNSDFSTVRKAKKLPSDGLQKFLAKYSERLKSDSLMCSTLNQCASLQSQINNLNIQYECTIKQLCLKPLQQILDVDVQNVLKLKRNFVKLHSELEHARSRFNNSTQKQQQLNKSTSSINSNVTYAPSFNKLDHIKKELEDTVNRYDQSKVSN